MNKLKVLKLARNIALFIGLYRPARFIYSNFLNRNELILIKEEIAFFSNFISPNDLCFDVGANSGQKTEALLKCGAKVIAFEPNPGCFQEIQSRFGRNPQLTLIKKALGSRLGEATFYVNHSHRAASSLVENWHDGGLKSEIEVSTITLDHAIAEYGLPKYCKIDVEGFELEVIKGLSQAIPLISLEYHLDTENIQKTLECIDILSNLGELTLNITPAEKLVFALENWLPQKDFLNFFLHEIPKISGYSYGDIFVKIDTSALQQS